MIEGDQPPASLSEPQEEPKRIIQGYSHEDLPKKIGEPSSLWPKPDQHEPLETVTQLGQTVSPLHEATPSSLPPQISSGEGAMAHEEHGYSMKAEQPSLTSIPVKDVSEGLPMDVEVKPLREAIVMPHNTVQKPDNKLEETGEQKDTIKGPEDCLRQATYLREKVHKKQQGGEPLNAEDIKDLQFASAWEMVAADYPNIQARHTLESLDKNLSLAS